MYGRWIIWKEERWNDPSELKLEKGGYPIETEAIPNHETLEEEDEDFIGTEEEVEGALLTYFDGDEKPYLVVGRDDEGMYASFELCRKHVQPLKKCDHAFDGYATYTVTWRAALLQEDEKVREPSFSELCEQAWEADRLRALSPQRQAQKEPEKERKQGGRVKRVRSWLYRRTTEWTMWGFRKIFRWRK